MSKKKHNLVRLTYNVVNSSRILNLHIRNFLRATDIEPDKTSIILFPGQGAQFVGMGKELVKLPKIKEMFQCANEILRTDILRTCLEGPVSKLSKTIHCQPATYIISLAAIAKLREENDEELCSYSWVIVFIYSSMELGLHIIRVRAEAMQKACDQKSGAMLTVFVNPGSPFKLAIAAAINHCEIHHKIQNPCCKVANYLYPDCKVLAGNSEVRLLQFFECPILSMKRLYVFDRRWLGYVLRMSSRHLLRLAMLADIGWIRLEKS
ncbi:unnamed protein product [Trichobilharzia regenti]|nr:unnamed protein product [Trichobilharzia regenti]